ncbi:MAG: EF-P 5-aminopentanol modification-associated protein YfmH [Planctomycetota bacterium]|jgi:predicted Zn-dependent peptidase
MQRATTVLRDPTLDEEVHRRVFPSGLTVYVLRKPEFTRSYATIATRYGSIDTRLWTNGRARRLPDGVAHFLEHKVFETPDGDAFDLFAASGASANAFTSFSSTRYLFGTSSEFATNLRILLNMVFDLYVTPETVEKEKGIIGQEIAMYEDDPGWRLYFGALQALYARHPLRIDIGGTVESIARISPELLRAVHATYYHPRNMVLAAVTPAPVEVTFRAVQECVEKRTFGRPPRRRAAAPREPRRADKASVRVALPVARPRVLLAFKDLPPSRRGASLLRRELASALALDCLFGNSGSVYMRLYEQGVVDDSFSCNYTADVGYAFAMVGGETDDVGRLRRALEKELTAALEGGLSESDFERVRNKVLGDYARAFNAPDRIAHMLVAHHLRGTGLSDYRDQLFRLTRADLNRRLRAMLDPGSRCYSVIVPRKK